MVSLRSMQALRAVVATGSITQAAEILHISQPAVSRTIADLEQELGFDIFTRSRGRLTITQQGEAFYLEATRALAAFDEIAMIGRQIKNGAGTMLRVFAMSSLVSDILSGSLMALREAYPSVRVNLEIRGGREVTHWGPGHHYDLGIVLIPDAQEMGTLKPFLRLPALVIMPRGHKLSSSPQITFAELADETLIMMPSTSIIRRWMDGEFTKVRKAPTAIIETSSMVSAAHYASLGLGLTVADPFAIHALNHGNFDVRPLVTPVSFNLAFALPPDEVHSRIVDQFMTIIASTATRMLPDVLGGLQPRGV